MSLSQRARTLLTARANPPVWMTRFSKTIGIPVIVLCLVAIYGLVFGRIVLNGSDSLAARGFYVVVWPKPLIRDAIVVSDPPARFTDKFAGLVFTKHLKGLPGDRIVHVDGNVCIKDACFAPGIKEGESFGTPLAQGIIPQGYVALFGETNTSLDSRYQEVGLFPISGIKGVGFAIPYFPDWTVLKERIGS